MYLSTLQLLPVQNDYTGISIMHIHTIWEVKAHFMMICSCCGMQRFDNNLKSSQCEQGALESDKECEVPNGMHLINACT
jgi:hypothetical protein